MAVYYIDFRQVLSKEDLYRTIKEMLPIPNNCGNNLDALHDILTEYGSDWDIIIYNTSDAVEQLGAYFTKFQRMCAAAQEEVKTLEIRFYP